jgi:hypothetical protein
MPVREDWTYNGKTVSRHALGMCGEPTMKCVLDTNIVNWLTDGKIARESLPADAHFVATHVLVDELRRYR